MLFSLNKSYKTKTNYFFARTSLVLIAVFTRQNNARCISVFIYTSFESDLTFLFSRGTFMKSYSYSPVIFSKNFVLFLFQLGC